MKSLVTRIQGSLRKLVTRRESASTGGISERAQQLHMQARQLGAAGEYERAITLFLQAQELVPDWPYPTYDLAFTYLLMEDFSRACEFYGKTVEMAPRGFMTAITAHDTLRREAAEELPAGTYSAYIHLETVEDPEDKAQQVASMVERLPQFAPAWKEYAILCEDPADRIEAIEKGLAANPDAETKGMLLVNRALASNEQGDARVAVEILEHLVSDPETTLANEQMGKHILSMMSK